eukprot:3700450-Rhodomonas_salina.3
MAREACFDVSLSMAHAPVRRSAGPESRGRTHSSPPPSPARNACQLRSWPYWRIRELDEE